MSTALEPLRHSKTILLTTYRRDGTPVRKPVSIAFGGDRAFIRTPHAAGKVKRLRNNPLVEAAPSTFRGKPTGAAVRARARLLDPDEAKLAATALSRRHRVLQGVLVPLVHRLMRYRTLQYELLPVQDGQQAG